DHRLGALKQTLSRVAIDGPIGRVQDAAQLVIFEIVDVAAGRWRPIGSEEQGELGVRWHLPPVQHRVESSLEPDCADRRAVVQLYLHIDADITELALDSFCHALADGITRLRDERETQRPAVTLANPVSTDPPSSLVEQRRRARRIECVSQDAVVVRPRY